MALPISVTYTFATATSAIPLSNLDSNFTTVVNAINGIGNGTNSLSNVSITGGNAVVTTANATTLNVSGEAGVGGNLTVTGGLVPSSSFLRNRIINGDMRIDQRNAGASVTPTDGGYSVDRWQTSLTQSGKYTVQQNSGSVTPPANFTNYLGAVSSSAYSVVSGDTFLLAQNIEGLNMSDLNWGSANARTITLSFWVRSSLTGTFGGALNNNGNSRSYPFTYTISATNTWEYKTITIPGDTSGTWLTNNGIGVSVRWSLGTGTTYSGTAGSWAGAAYFSATGATSVVGTNGATFYITGVQFEVGSVATPFERRQYTTELQLCQRYFQKSYRINVVPGSNSAAEGQTGAYMCPYLASGNTLRGTLFFKVNMRTSPTVTTYNPETGTAGYWAVEGSGATNQAASGVTFLSDTGVLVYSTNSPVAGHYYISWKAEVEL